MSTFCIMNYCGDHFVGFSNGRCNMLHRWQWDLGWKRQNSNLAEKNRCIKFYLDCCWDGSMGPRNCQLLRNLGTEASAQGVSLAHFSRQSYISDLQKIARCRNATVLICKIWGRLNRSGLNPMTKNLGEKTNTAVTFRHSWSRLLHKLHGVCRQIIFERSYVICILRFRSILHKH